MRVAASGGPLQFGSSHGGGGAVGGGNGGADGARLAPPGRIQIRGQPPQRSARAVVGRAVSTATAAPPRSSPRPAPRSLSPGIDGRQRAVAATGAARERLWVQTWSGCTSSPPTIAGVQFAAVGAYAATSCSGRAAASGPLPWCTNACRARYKDTDNSCRQMDVAHGGALVSAEEEVVDVETEDESDEDAEPRAESSLQHNCAVSQPPTGSVPPSSTPERSSRWPSLGGKGPSLGALPLSPASEDNGAQSSPASGSGTPSVGRRKHRCFTFTWHEKHGHFGDDLPCAERAGDDNHLAADRQDEKSTPASPDGVLVWSPGPLVLAPGTVRTSSPVDTELATPGFAELQSRNAYLEARNACLEEEVRALSARMGSLEALVQASIATKQPSSSALAPRAQPQASPQAMPRRQTSSPRRLRRSGNGRCAALDRVAINAAANSACGVRRLRSEEDAATAPALAASASGRGGYGAGITPRGDSASRRPPLTGSGQAAVAATPTPKR